MGQWIVYPLCSPGDSGKVTTVVATLGQGPERSQEVAYTDIKVIGNGSFGVVYQARLAETRELVAIKKVLQDKRFKVAWAGWGQGGLGTGCDWWENPSQRAGGLGFRAMGQKRRGKRGNETCGRWEMWIPGEPRAFTGHLLNVSA